MTIEQFKQFALATEFKLADNKALKGEMNAPVAYVSQQEALQFCHWLTSTWRQKGRISDKLKVTLPNEPEWEKAVRGGMLVPAQPVVIRIDTGLPENLGLLAMAENIEPQRRYPWGNDIDEEKLNFSMNVGGVFACGVYPSGASPYGCHDLSGNVWEWTRSELAEYPYPAVSTKAWKQRERPGADISVLRGGAFDFGHSYVRCAVRGGFKSVGRDGLIGFRVVLSSLL